MIRLIVLLTTVLLFVSPPAHSHFLCQPIPSEGQAMASPDLACSLGGGLGVLVYSQSGDPLLQDFVMAMPFSPTVGCLWGWDYDAVTLAPGEFGKVCSTTEKFLFAVSSGDMVLFRSMSHGGTLDPDEELRSPQGPILEMDLFAMPYESPAYDAILVIETMEAPDMDTHCLQISYHQDNSWSEFQTVVSGLTAPAHPKLTRWAVPNSNVAELLFLDGSEGDQCLTSVADNGDCRWDLSLASVNRITSPLAPVAGPFDVITYLNSSRSVVGLGPQPACPCGTIHHLEFIYGQWQPSRELTQDHGPANWPFAPALSADWTGRVHAFWCQETTNDDMTPGPTTLEYHTFYDGQWTDAGDFLDPSDAGFKFGREVAIAVTVGGSPVLAHTRIDTLDGIAQEPRVYVSRWGYDIFSDTPETPLSPDHLEITAWPNPFNPSVTLAIEAVQPQKARLDIFDTRGHLVANILDEVVASGRTTAVWNGRDSNGTPVSSGVYYTRLQMDGKTAVKKLILAK